MPTLTNFASRIRTRGSNPATESKAPRWSPNWFANESGQSFNSERALGLPAVSAAVNRIADQIAAFPLHIFQASPTGEPARVEDARSDFWRDPNPEVGPFTLWRLVFAHKVVRENAYLFVVKSN